MRKLALALVLILSAAPLEAQVNAPPAASGPELIDRVVAVVGDTVLLLSDVQTDISQMVAAGQPLPTDPVQREAIVQEIITSRIGDLIIAEAAKDAGVEVADDDVAPQVETSIQTVIQRVGGQQRLEAALAQEGLTLEQYRATLMEQARGQRQAEIFVGQAMQHRARPLISEEQLRAAFQERRAELGQRPVSFTLQQVVVKTEPADTARAVARREAERVLTELRAGGDFEVLARRFSDDPSNAEQGGDLGWFKRGVMVAEFDNVVFALQPGQTSGIVSTDFGFHVIRLDRVRSAERKARHILIRPEVTSADTERARQRADSVAAALRGGASATVLARAYGTASSEAEVARVALDQLPPAYRTALQNATTGQIVGPVEVAGNGVTNFAVVRVAARQEAGEYTLDDVREPLLESLQQQLMQAELVEELRSRVYVRVID